MQKNHRFDDLVEDIKYGVKPGVVFLIENLAKILEALYKLEYKNCDLQKMIFDKVKKIYFLTSFFF